jgi:hypothetical protein
MFENAFIKTIVFALNISEYTEAKLSLVTLVSSVGSKLFLQRYKLCWF